MLKRKPPGRHFDALQLTGFEHILRHYQLGDLISVNTVVIEGDRVILLGEKSETSRKYVLETSTGWFFLKEVPWYCDQAEHIEFSVGLGNYLAGRGLPVALALRCADGAPYVSAGGSRYILFEYRPGRLYDGSDRHRTVTGQALGRMHRLVMGYIPSGQAAVESIQDVVREHLALAAEVRPGQAGDRDFEALGNDLLSQLPDEMLAFTVHGDFIPWNVAYDNAGGVSAIYDFDNACYGSPLRDLGKALSSFYLLPYAGSGTRLKPLGAESATGIPDMTPMIRSYQDERPLSGQEMELLPRYVLGGFAVSVLLSLIRGEQADTTAQTMAILFKAVRTASELALS